MASLLEDDVDDALRESLAAPDSTVTSEAPKETRTNVNKFLPPCEVCGGVSTGLHFGCPTCEACKTFFRRFLARKQKPACIEEPPNQCEIDMATSRSKYPCAACRYKKCLDIGMAAEGAKKGRYSYTLKTQQTKEYRRREAAANQQVQQHIHLPELEQELQHITKEFQLNFSEITFLIENRELVDERMSAISPLLLDKSKSLECFVYIAGSKGETDTKFQVERANNFLKMFEHAKQPTDSWCEMQNIMRQDPRRLFAAQTLHDIWTPYMELTVREALKFAKTIPQFSALCIEDKVTLMKSAKLDLEILLRDARYAANGPYHIIFRMDTDELILFPVVSVLETIHNIKLPHNARLIERLALLNLTLGDLAVLSTVLILSPDREGLLERDRIAKFQEELVQVLEYTLMKNHSGDRKIFAEVLLLLPLFRERSLEAQAFMKAVSLIFEPETWTPLLNEVFSDLSLCRNPERTLKP